MYILYITIFFLSIILITISVYPFDSVVANSCGPTEVQTKRVVGYWQGNRNLHPIQVYKMTHLIYAFVPHVQNGSLLVRDYDLTRIEWMHLAKRSYNPRLKLMFSIGGASNSQYFSKALADNNGMEMFITSILDVVKTHEFDGVDVDWESPQTEADKNNYVLLMQRLCVGLEELRSLQHRSSRYILSFASPYDKWTLMRGYDLPRLTQVVDFINVMTYDYYAAWSAPSGCLTGPPAPLYGGVLLWSENVDSTMRHYACTTRQVKKLNLGIPFYGRYWNNVPNFFFDPLYRSASPSIQGGCDGGAVKWRDIPNSWGLNTSTLHDIAKAPYIYHINGMTTRFLGFENPESIRHKINYTISHNLGGVGIWAIDQDDDNNQMIQSVIERVEQFPDSATIVYGC